ncbi:asparagine synthetase B family protein [Methyloversatilis thermotolerans]|uniref:asparagine synthetase B family protein n=1 Tax=Methyloversatilis thermotolerans TaxID=1346290 RepID=UPI00036419EB|nr:asparagine synthetase B family protein [Methyloversatilis thermotolerans]
MSDAHGCFDPRSGSLTLSAGWRALADGLYCAGAGFEHEPAHPLLEGHAPTCDGPYALAGLASDCSSLVLARDPAGALSLFWHRDRDGVLNFALTLPTLLSRLPQHPPWSPASLDEYLRHLDIAPPNTLYQGVHALEPGQATLFDGHGSRDLPAATHAVELPDDYEGACEQLAQRLSAAIARRLDGARAPAAFLSGGVDSSLLCALAARDGHPISAWSAAFADPALDESTVASRIAAHLGLRHQVIRLDTTALLEVFERAHAQAEQPYCDPAGGATRLMFEACAAQCDRVLDGTGAEALPGTAPARWRRIAHDWLAPMPRPLRRAAAGLLRPLPGIGGYARLFDFEQAHDLFIRWNGFSAQDIAALTGRPADLSGTRFMRDYRALRGATHAQRLAVLQGAALPDDRIRQAWLGSGLRVDHPFSAPDVTALMTSLPADWCRQPGRDKRPLRDLLARQVPESIWAQPKRGFNIDLLALLRADHHALIRRWLDADGLARLPLDAATVRQWRDRFLNGETWTAHRVWALLNLSAWTARHGDGAH